MKSVKNGALAVVAALAIGGQLYAQPADPDGLAQAPGTGDPASPSRRLSAAEMVTRATELEAQIKVDSQHVQHLQAMARKEKDVIRLSCVNDKMVRVKAGANIFDGSNRDLAGALDRDERFTYFDSVLKAADDVHKAREEADRCAGEVELESESKSTFTGPDIVDDPTSGLPFDEPGTLIEPPGYASPFS